MDRVSCIVAPHAATRETVGGKGMALERLARFGQPVPAWFGIHPRAMRETLQHSMRTSQVAAQVDRIRRDPYALTDVCRTIQRIFHSAKLPEELKYEIDEARRALLDPNAYVAVRASSLEDDDAQGFAGLHDSALFLRDPEELLDGVRRVWGSAYGERALSHRLEHGLDLDPIRLAVVVQTMVEARSSGVMRTVHLDAHDLERVEIRALWGTGEGLGAGLETDTFLIDKDDFEIVAETAHKPQQMVLNGAEGFGLMRAPVPDSQRDKRCLSQDEARRLAEAGVAIERACGRPQEIEFAIDVQGRPHILQTRPVTEIDAYGPAAGQKQLWERTHLVEGCAEVTTPMTVGFLRRAFNAVSLDFAQAMGAPYNELRARQWIFANLLGMARGRLCVHVHNFYRLASMLPGGEANHPRLESLLGLSPSPPPEDAVAPPAPMTRRLFVDLPARLGAARRVAALGKTVPAFLGRCHERLAEWRGRELEAMRPYELMALHREIENQLLWTWRVPTMNDFESVVAYDRLRTLCRDWCGDGTGSLQNDLLCGLGGLESAEPIRMLMELASSASATPDLRELLVETPAADLAAQPPDPLRFPGFSDLLQEFLTRYGDRCQGELRLEQASLREDPTLVFQTLKNYLAADALPDFQGLQDRESHLREQAEAVVRDTVPLWKRPWFNRALARARRALRDRDNLRFARARIQGLVRDIARTLGGVLERERVLREAGDVFYLTFDELRDYVRGTAVAADLQGIADVRRAEYDRYREESAPDERFTTFGMAYHRNIVRRPAPTGEAASDGPLRGTGCCPGKVEGPVVVAEGPRADLDLRGEILVADRIDPGWVPYFPSVSGLLIEHGGPLCHAISLAREMGVPTIAGIPGLLRRVQEGAHVRMDGAAGTVELVAPEPEADG